MNLDVGIVVAGAVWGRRVCYPVCVMAVLSLGMLAGWPLMWGAIAAEDSDAFDAISRSYAYTFQRPLHYLFYACFASFIALLGCVTGLVVFGGGDSPELLVRPVRMWGRPSGGVALVR